MTPHPSAFAAVLVGGGPAGFAVLLNADKEGTLRTLLRRGLLMVERSAAPGRGTIGDYLINSDSTGATFLHPLQHAREGALRRILRTPVAKRIAQAGHGAVPLADVGELMALIGQAFCTIVAAYPRSRIMTCCTAQFARRSAGGIWRIGVADGNGRTEVFEAQQLVLATGAGQPAGRLASECVAGVPVQERWGGRLVQSGDLLTQAGLEAAAKCLRGRRDPKVAILGGSTSAVAVAHALLHRADGVAFEEGAITLFHRKPLRVYYAGTAEALADGYDEFGPDDVCPVSKRLYRFAGLRLDSRELLMQVRGLAGRAPEPRVVLHQLGRNDEADIRGIDQADLVVAAFGYRPNALPLFDESNCPIALLAETAPSAPLVDEECRVLQADGEPLPGVYGIGLAAGYRPRGKFGGEPSFLGQANGLWLWQNGIGGVIAQALLTSPAAPEVRSIANSLTRARHAICFPAMEIA
ncbi:MAG: hypothetical protein ACRYF4_02745 [Janthinobacterium lividum]